MDKTFDYIFAKVFHLKMNKFERRTNKIINFFIILRYPKHYKHNKINKKI